MFQLQVVQLELVYNRLAAKNKDIYIYIYMEQLPLTFQLTVAQKFEWCWFSRNEYHSPINLSIIHPYIFTSLIHPRIFEHFLTATSNQAATHAPTKVNFGVELEELDAQVPPKPPGPPTRRSSTERFRWGTRHRGPPTAPPGRSWSTIGRHPHGPGHVLTCLDQSLTSL